GSERRCVVAPAAAGGDLVGAIGYAVDCKPCGPVVSANDVSGARKSSECGIGKRDANRVVKRGGAASASHRAADHMASVAAIADVDAADFAAANDRYLCGRLAS